MIHKKFCKRLLKFAGKLANGFLFSLRCIQLETKLSEKTQELMVAQENIKSLNDINRNVIQKSEELTEKLKDMKDNNENTNELFQQEVEAQSKLADLYKGLSEQSKSHSEELSDAVAEVSRQQNRRS